MTNIATLDQYGLLQAAGDDARAFLHGQLTNDIENLAPGQARYAGWCSAKGRLLATFLVVPFAGGFLLQLSRDLVPAVAKRLSMFILRSKVKLTDASAQWAQFGVWGPGKEDPLSVSENDGSIAVRIDADRSLVLAPGGRYASNVSASDWALAEVRAGRPLILQSTQDLFVPQMVNFELSGGVDFRKGCYPGQEIVARAQYRGTVKRRMYRLRGGPLQPGQDLYGDDTPGQAGGSVGTVVNTAGDESLAVLQISAVEGKSPVRAQPQAAALEILSLPYSQ
jgi:folate-binding protein YgfZ